MNRTPIYTHNGAYAREHGELTQYRESLLTNIACKNAIETSIDNHFDGMHLDKAVLPEVMKEFSAKRVAFVLAATIQHKNYDGRFYRGNKAWAAEIDTAFSVSPSYDPRPSFCVESHPTVLDGFVELFRKEMCRERKPSVLQKPQAKSVEPPPLKPKAPIRRSADLER